MSRIYQDSALGNKAVRSAHFPGAWDPSAHQGGKGVLVEGELVDVSRHSIVDAHGRKERYYVLYIRPGRIHHRRFDPQGKEIEPNFSATRKPEEIQQQIVRETFHLVLKRDDNICNFLEGGSLIGGSDYKLIYRHYATLYFVFCVDSSESELGILDLIQVFVETLDKCFENVCELDLIFHMDKVHYILQEVVMGGMVLETNMNEIVAQMEAQNRLEKSEGGLSAAPARAVSAVKNMNLPEIPRNINIGDLNIKVPNLSQFV
ncbi:AP-3 complex subunit sigma-2 isoform X1 [Fukomys damarensis]|uniref:AP-3 complex subunit sigma-2 isoform X1 n=1 Tax=Fukomys damarensis TaxID=885580 RepID=UPI0008FEC8B7|nr:AP-3 complex subunit sigma-2 isoform X1 [Fukomys damarensis]